MLRYNIATRVKCNCMHDEATVKIPRIFRKHRVIAQEINMPISSTSMSCYEEEVIGGK